MDGENRHGCDERTVRLREVVTPHQGFQAGITLALLAAVAMLTVRTIWLSGGRPAGTHQGERPIPEGGTKGRVAPQEPSSQPSAPPAAEALPIANCQLPIEPLTTHHSPLTTEMMTVTAYCPCRECCGPDARGITASGKPVTANGGWFVAAPRSVPFGTLVEVPGYSAGVSKTVPVLDRGGAITDGKLDVFFPTHRQALEWGVKRLAVRIYGQPSLQVAAR